MKGETMFKKLKLAPKLAIIIGCILTAIFVMLIATTAALSKAAISNATYGELNAISENNGNKIQQIFDTAENAAVSIQNYLNKSYKLAADDPSLTVISTVPEAAALCQSVIYKRTLAPVGYDAEQFITETARNTAVINSDIAGMGIMFEPYKFQQDIRDYAMYIDENNTTGEIEPYGAYETYNTQVFYQEAASTKKAIVTEPYDFNGIKMISYAAPILSGTELQGVVMADVSIENFAKIDSTNAKYPSMFATILDDEGDIIYDSKNLANTGTNIATFTPDQKELEIMKTGMAGGKEFTMVTTSKTGLQHTRFFTPINAAGTTWWSLTALETSDIFRTVNQTLSLLSVLSVAALVLLIFVTVIVLKRMLNPMQPVVLAAQSISQGNLDVSVASHTEDEIGALASSFGSMSDTLKKMVDDVSYLLGEMSDGNFNIRTKAEESYVGAFESFLLSIRKLNHTLSNTLSQINQSADQVASGSEQVSSGAQALSQGATEQASSIQELAATINEISTQIQQTSVNAAKAKQETALAGDDSQQCNLQMQEMISAINDISNSSNEIGKIIKTIEDIAFQTNILALNAAVEAARAGQAGKGFAVVADEVRNLASKSAEASKNTALLIENSIHAVEKGTSIASDTAKSLDTVVQRTQSISNLVDQIAVDASTQASAIAQVTAGVDQISSVIQTNSATAEESAAASEELSGQSQMLKDLVSKFKLREY